MTEQTLTPAQMRVAIAQDAIATLTAGRFNIRSGGGYLYGEVISPVAVDPQSDVQQHFEVLAVTCQVCALGVCLLIKAKLFDAVTMYDAGFRTYAYDTSTRMCASRDSVVANLRDVFADDQLDLIEAAFEQTAVVLDFDADKEAIDEAIQFGQRYYDHADRAVAIFRNIIANGGDFDPTSDTPESVIVIDHEELD